MDGVNQAHNVNHVPANLTNTTGNNNPGVWIWRRKWTHTYVGYGKNIMISFGYQGYFAQSNFSANLNPWGYTHRLCENDLDEKII